MFSAVPEDWTVAELQHFLKWITYGFTNPMPTTKRGPLKLTAKNIRDGRIDYLSARHTSKEAFDKLTKKSKPKVNDILLTKDGTLGRVAVVDRSNICINQSIALLRPNKRIDPYFLKYLLQAPYYQNKMEQDASGTTIKHIYITKVDKMKVAVPPINIQRKIAGTLKNYDDLIRVNLRSIQILEEIATNLYRKWFVDFRYPGHENAKIIQTSHGHIPEGWEYKQLGDITYNHDHRRVPLSTMERSKRKGIYPYYGASKVLDYIDGYIFDGKYLLIAEDGSVITPDGYPVLQLVDGKFWANNHTHVVQAKHPLSTSYLYLYLKNFHISGYVTGTAQPKINQTNLNRVPVLVPSIEILELFNGYIEDIFNLRNIYTKKNDLFVKMRDLLISPLVFGEIDMNKAHIN